MEAQVEKKSLVARADSSAIISDGVKRSLEKGMRILSDIEQTRPDGTVFKFEVDLMYELSRDKATPRAPPGLCPANCQLAECDNSERTGGAKFLCCSKCGAKYCSRNCQVRDWKRDHKVMCNQLRDMRKGRAATKGAGQGVLDRQGTVARVLGQVRLYLCPFAVCHGETQGRGFIFLQTPNPLLELEYMRPVNSNGQRMERSVILHFLSLGEFVDAVMQDDFELGVVRSALEAAVGSYNPKKELVILFRARCGYMAVLVLPMVPDLSVCRQLAVDYVGKSALQLNLD